MTGVRPKTPPPTRAAISLFPPTSVTLSGPDAAKLEQVLNTAAAAKAKPKSGASFQSNPFEDMRVKAVAEDRWRTPKYLVWRRHDLWALPQG